MQGVIRCGLLAGFLVACNQTSPAKPDGNAPDGSGGGPAGMHLVWLTSPQTWPLAIDNGFTLEDATFTFDNLKVIGDATAGDETSKSIFQIEWDATHSPDPIDFPDAPPGLYSKVSFELDGHVLDASYRLHGHIDVMGTSTRFEIEDRMELPLSLQCDRTLAPGGSVTISVLVSFSDALKSVDWSLVHANNGELQLETTDPQMPNFRDKLTHGFAIDNAGPN